jgi:hypothetical protein
MLNDTDLDTSYTALCHTMTAVGEAKAQLFLARFALLAMARMPSAAQALALIDAAQQDMGAAPQPQDVPKAGETP